MSLTTPILLPIIPFDATQPYTFKFNSIGGSQVVKSNLVIQRNDTSEEIYNEITDNFAFTHDINASILSNTIQYKAQIRTGNVSGDWSEFSDWIVFWCFQPADVDIANIVDGVVNAQTYQFVGEYVDYGDSISSYRFYLYNYEGQLLESSNEIFSDTITYTFGGLQNNEYYKIELKTISQNNVEISTGLITFLASYIQPVIGSVVVATNNKESGYIQLDCSVVQVIGEGNNFTYENSDWIDVTSENAIVSFQEGLNWNSLNWALKLRFKSIPENKVFCRILGINGNIEISYINNRFHTYRYTTITSHFVNNEDIIITPEEVVVLEIKNINGLIDVFVDKAV